ncbi:hypothetical protein RJ640_010196 [Escallonia rubra]|uniref:Cellulose synthase-like protein E6 n=1 Tax=Escallonia rubra TaxID=112253 RepID=A0AA88RBM2_9ASTE|nr:hypothetical protein RJ640_010196 [Escallonia rubra]
MVINRYEKVLPSIDVFVCTADPQIEPPLMVINTVLSLMAYNYPPEKLNIYLSDDGGSDFMFYALLEASRFSAHWLPFCRKLKIEPKSPAAYFAKVCEPPNDPVMANEWSSIKVYFSKLVVKIALLQKSYEELKKRIDDAMKLGRISAELRKEHKGFCEWDLILIDGRETKAVDVQGQPLPTLVYLAREKRPQYHHNFKAGALNALLRVSSRISNGPIVLTVDCDMYSNNSESVRDAMCFFMDEERGHDIAFVQYPQQFDNITKNDIYSSSLTVTMEVEMAGLDANGGPCYIGTGCFHRRDILCGKKYSKECKIDWNKENTDRKVQEGADVLEDTCRVLASCTYEVNTKWGKEMGLKYGCPVEDVITGLAIQCRGWRSVFYNPERKGFLGVAPTTLLQSLVQHKRWSEGDFQIFRSRYCPFVYGHKRIPLKLQISYCFFLLWAPNCLATLYYAAVPSLCLLKGIPLFPKISNPWTLAFAYVMIAKYAYSLGEFLWYGGTFQGWWNDQRMWVYKRLTSYLFGFLETIFKSIGFAKSGFVVTAKTSEEDVSSRYEKEVMEFGAASPMFNILATVALVNLLGFVAGVKRVILNMQNEDFNLLALQIILCGLVVLINLPLYQGLFFRKDNGRMPSSVRYQSILVAVFASLLAWY